MAQGERSASTHTAASSGSALFQILKERMKTMPASMAISPAAAYSACMRGVDSDFAMADRVMMPVEQSSSTRISTARSTGQAFPASWQSRYVAAGMAAASTAACGWNPPPRKASRAMASA